jgi:putative xylitol transport system permease protein
MRTAYHRGWARGAVPLVILMALCAIAAFATPRFLSPLNLGNILLQSAIIGVIAVGMTFVMVGGGFDLSVGSVVALSGCVMATIMSKYGVATGVCGGVTAGALVGLVNGFFVGILRVNPFITTLGTMVLVRGLVFLLTGGAPIDDLPSAFLALGSGHLLGVHVLVWCLASIAAIVSFVMRATPYGRWIYATGGGREAAFLSGIPVTVVTVSTYVWSGLLSGVAGIMLAARLESGQPTAGEFYELTAISAVILGGASLHGGEGRVWRSIVGVFIIVVLGNGLNLLGVDSYWQRVAIGVVILIAAALSR